MTERKLSLEEATSHFRDISTRLPSIHNKRPSRQFIVDLLDYVVEKYSAIPCHQSNDTGWAGAIVTETEHLLHNAAPFIIPTDPGVLQLPPLVTRAEQANLERQHSILVDRFETYTNLNQAARAALETVIPRQYRPGVTMGNSQSSWPSSWNVAQILQTLRRRYNKLSGREKENVKTIFNSPYDPTRPIEELISRLEECHRISIDAEIGYTTEQLIDQLVTRLQPHRIYEDAIQRWKNLDEADRDTWQNAKEHFIIEYERILDSANDSLTSGSNGYANLGVGAGAGTTVEDDNVSLADTVEDLGTAFHSFGETYNSNISGLNENLSTINNATQSNATSIQHLSQQVAMLTTQVAQGQQRYAPPQAPSPFTIQPSPPQYVPPSTYNSYNQGGGQGGYQSRGGRRRSNNRSGQRQQQARNQGTTPQYQAPPTPPAAGAIQQYRPPTGHSQQRGNRSFQPNPVKRYSNWFVCHSCGFDVDHESHQCQQKKSWHRNDFSRANYLEFERMGWPFCRKGIHKTQLPPM